MKKIEAWKTDDGKVWETECAAEMHEKRVKAEKLIVDLYYPQMIECATDLIEFLDANKLKILDIYGRA